MSEEIELKVGNKFQYSIDVGNGKPKDSRKYRRKMVEKTFTIVERDGVLMAECFELLSKEKWQRYEIILPSKFQKEKI